MGEIRHKQVGGGGGIEYVEIVMPDERDWGTGSYVTVFRPKPMASKEVVMSALVNLPRFQVTASINPDGLVAVLLGDSQPKDRVRLQLPQEMSRGKLHSLQIDFASWRVVNVLFDSQALMVHRLALA
jgi:hypothetical protein